MLELEHVPFFRPSKYSEKKKTDRKNYMSILNYGKIG